MRLCLKYNSTIANMKMPDGGFVDFDERKKEFIGPGGGGAILLDSFLLKRKKETQDQFFRYCTFKILAEGDGLLLPNGSYSGVIGQLQRNEADFTIKVENMYVDPEVISLSRVFGVENWYIGHFINTTTKKESKFLDYDIVANIFMPSKLLFIEFISIFIVSFLIGLILLSLSKKFKINDYYLNFFNFSNKFIKKDPYPIGFFFLFNILSLFLIKQILSCNINVSKVIVDKEVLLYDKFKIYTTELEFCQLMRNKDNDYFQYSHPNTLQYFLFFNKTDPKNPCIIFGESGLNLLSNFFLLGIKLHLPVLRTLNAIYKLDIFFNENPLFSMNSVLYMSKAIKKLIKKELNQFSIIHLERGFFLKFNSDSYFQLEKSFPITGYVYYNKEEYIKRNSFISNLSYQNFSVFLKVYLMLIVIYSIINLIILKKINLNVLKKLIKKLIKK